ncbi:acyl-CoA dehydrogenase family protein [Paraburkholderia panacisoli]|uniref:Acyl-CoA dehydrogenase family protein n=1 Tax=Paraburkholderia panacisoli TaxID=2603818 RepID=A0A5B0GL50_9BURK|nr:acyl-CoA dehydrogenase family protein [Paraburkholderia panacisoli]KAA1004174.1 acyl-CoA dehydrogenase family protein [Paraburkholderia panacisoli]
MTGHILTDAQLDERYAPIFERIADDSIEREQNRELAHDAVKWLKESGFTALRVPRAYGGAGITLPQFFRQLSRLGAADSNLPQILRAHFGFIEYRLESTDETQRRVWLERVANGETVGAATSERTGSTHNSVTLTRDAASGVLRLNGEKYYSTGTLYADWISVAAHDDDTDINVVIPATAPGVTRIDDWDGFGQRLTASGTTRLDAVAVAEEWVLSRYRASEPRRNSFLTAYFQAVHLATLAGIVEAIVHDSVAFTQGRTRTFGVAGQSSPRDNPLVQRVVGRLASLRYSTRSIVDSLAHSLEAVHRKRELGISTADDYIAVDIEAYQAQQIVIEQTLEAATLLFEVCGASATSETRRFDRHWRNARTIASHNPAAQREASIGRYYLNGTPSEERFSLPHAEGQGIAAGVPSQRAAARSAQAVLAEVGR